ncbi:thiamine pyrophosphate-binding protein [Ramlibacter sp. AW1]|uniref:Thiamine pyrophosphate-binding protein n=1 Tax=Ramlibacter aurantiacus TaxID=2801330 RepID=A0A936ZNT7_9BURK|nr:thiamine pyrophosphate-binding protein [Ramlibacter aurantiacus]MBL0420723.1 thiamine pyrophosphate-binding protein [Ramlibacter aurantiacus]
MKISGAELIARCLVGNGITHVFNVPGLGLQPLIDALRRHREELQYYCGPSETAVALMADGYGRATRRPAFVNVYHASGTALAMMGVTTAWADRSPMLFTSTTTSRKLARSDGYAAVPRDVTEMPRQFVKWDWEVPSVERIPDAIARAVAIAQTPPMGPVHLAFPADLYTEEIDESVLEQATGYPPGRLQAFTATRPDAEGLAAAAALLADAKRPVIVAGGDVAQYGAVDAMVRLAERLGAPVLAEPYVAYPGFPNTHPLYAGRCSGTHPLLREADVVLIAGAELTGGGGAPLLPPRTAKVVFLASDLLDLGKQVWADVGLVGHPRESLRELAEAVAARPRQDRPAWDASVREAVAAFRGQLQADHDAPASSAHASVTVPQLIDQVHEVFGKDAVIVDHSTTGTAYLLDMLPLDDPSRYYGISGRASAQGWGTPAAIGMQVALPDRQVVALAGDGGFMFTGNTLYAAALWNVPIKLIVLANGGWHDVAHTAKHARGWSDEDLRAARWVADPKVDFTQLAASFGIAARRAATPSELREALVQARDSAGPFVVEVETDPAAIDYYVRWVTR